MSPVSPRPIIAMLAVGLAHGLARDQVEAVAKELRVALASDARLVRFDAPGDAVFVYAVRRSTYTEYGGYSGEALEGWTSANRTWARGERSPYKIAVTVFPQPSFAAGLSPVEWALGHWFTKQGPMSEMMQPRARYVRRVVTEALDADAPPLGGIVVEAWPSLWHVLNPFLFFGAGRNPYRVALNVAVMLSSVTRFTHLSQLQQATMGEYLFSAGGE